MDLLDGWQLVHIRNMCFFSPSQAPEPTLQNEFYDSITTTNMQALAAKNHLQCRVEILALSMDAGISKLLSGTSSLLAKITANIQHSIA